MARHKRANAAICTGLGTALGTVTSDSHVVIWGIYTGMGCSRKPSSASEKSRNECADAFDVLTVKEGPLMGYSQ